MPTREELLLQKLKEAAVALHKTTAERDELQRKASEPIAIVGMGCRLPGGVEGPSDFWKLLVEGRDAVRSLDDRWKLVGARPGPGVPAWAGLLDDVAGF